MPLAASFVSQLPTWIGAAVLMAIAWTVYRGGGGSALSVLKDANETLAHRVRELENQARHDQAQIALLTARTDITVALQPLTRALELHEQHATDRGTAQLAVLEMIASKLGPDELVD